MSLLRGVLSTAISASIAIAAGNARADFEFWTPIEARVPVARTQAPTWPRVDLRLVTEPRFAGRFTLAEWALDVGPWMGLFVDVPKLGERAAPTQVRPISAAPSSSAVAEGR